MDHISCALGVLLSCTLVGRCQGAARLKWACIQFTGIHLPFLQRYDQSHLTNHRACMGPCSRCRCSTIDLREKYCSPHREQCWRSCCSSTSLFQRSFQFPVEAISRRAGRSARHACAGRLVSNIRQLSLRMCL